ncbi:MULTISPECIES: sugar ABC transporter substrate-binding protein [Actinoalloteichus]|uniref:sugar ABC transporter substrate-binding protein n=1 Tax=Actinoalloteichus TaxID=65496 RepID=UPI0012F996ED|nr:MULTISPECIES: sugar ABC transporter substrate-binding protein [Actinoalloteichus]
MRTSTTGSDDPARAPADETVRRRAEEADRTAADCWVGLLAGCDSPARRDLSARLLALSTALSSAAGQDRWNDSAHGRRVSAAALRIGAAVEEGDGEEFAEAVSGYDQTVATAVVSLGTRLGSSTV